MGSATIRFHQPDDIGLTIAWPAPSSVGAVGSSSAMSVTKMDAIKGVPGNDRYVMDSGERRRLLRPVRNELVGCFFMRYALLNWPREQYAARLKRDRWRAFVWRQKLCSSPSRVSAQGF
jgi:hypothetical protein